jgi:RNA polymerase sigma factor (sigma-70 family)
MSTDSIKDYLTEIGRFPLLTGEQEIQLSRQVRRMIELQAMEGERTKEELRAIKRGQRARETMMNCNLRLVVHIAKNYVTRLKSNGLELMDLIQEGAIGLNRAVELFDGTKGYKFSTYGYWWIRQSITRAIDTKERLIRVPQHVLDATYKIAKMQREHLQQHGRPMSTAECAERMEMSQHELQSHIMRNVPHSSLDQLVRDDGSPLVDMIVDEHQSYDDSLSIEYAEQLELALSFLADRDRDIVASYHGLGAPKKTQGKIAEELGITRSAVGQIHDRSMRRLRLMLTEKR